MNNEFQDKYSVINEDEYQNDHINFREIIEKYLFYWKWILFGMLLALIIGYLKLQVTSNEYKSETSIIINNHESGSSSELAAFSDLSLFGGSKTPMENEIAQLKSQTLMDKVVSKLNLNISYYIPNKRANSEIYGAQIPFKINYFIPDSIFNQIDTSFQITAISRSRLLLSDTEGENSNEYDFGKNIITKFGELNVIPNSQVNDFKEFSIIVQIEPKLTVIERFRKSIDVSEPNTPQSTLLYLSLVDPVLEKAKTVLNTIVEIYNQDGVYYRSEITANTDRFIDSRILDISNELNIVDQGVEEFKTKNRLTDMTVEAEIALQSDSDINNKIINFQSQLKLIDYLLANLQKNTDDFLPTNLGIEDNNTSQNASMYNQLLLEKNRLLKGSSELNPTVINLSQQLNSLRQAIIQNLSNLRSKIEISLNQAKIENSRIDSKRYIAPKQEREFQDILRKRQIIEALYLYLLQKKEENAIKQGATFPNAKIIDRAEGSSIPVKPAKLKTMAIYGMAGVLIPVLIIFLITAFDNKIHNMDDLEKYLSAPIIGDVPKYNSRKKINLVKSQDRDSLAEAFRIIRTNLNYMLSQKNQNGQIIVVTSTIAGEGKTMTSLNLASTLAATNKKVIIIGADLRKPKISSYLKVEKGKGLTHFLVDENTEISQIIKSDPEYGFDIINSWEIPPNPSDLISNGRFELVLDYVKERYDYIIVDTAPLGLVTDTMMLVHNSDLLIYVVRANMLDKRLLKAPQKLYQDERFGKMAVILNGCNFKRKGYGYGYGNS